MAISQSAKVTIRPLAALLVLIFAGAVQAWNCGPGYIDCNACVNPQTDANNCGKCGVKCAACANAVPVCKAGNCEFSCKTPYKNCDNSWANGCEVDSSKDVNNCGACGTKCIAPPHASAMCYNGNCQYTCNAGWKNCDGKWENGCETDVSKDIGNCGGCGTKCSAAANATPMCNNQQCVHACQAGWMNCDNDWTNGCECAPATDVDNCGGCGNKCPQPNYFGGEARCNSGKCETQSCKAGMQYDGAKRCCVSGGGGKGDGNGGGNGDGNNGGGNGDGDGNGGDQGGAKGGDQKGGDQKGGSKGGDQGSSKGGNKGGAGGGW